MISMRFFQRQVPNNGLTATDDDVRHAYRLLLGREPDAVGLATYMRLVRERKLPPEELGQCFLASDEFRSKQRGGEMVKVALPGYCLFVSPTDRDIGAAIAVNHAYEPYVEAALRRVLATGDTFVDIGANIGYFTALGASIVGPKGRVIACEPLDKNLQLIYATVWDNRFANVTVLPFAASSESRLVAMGSSVVSSNAGIVPRVIGEERMRLMAQAQRIDDMLATVDRIDVIKFDIEGHEMHAWRGGAKVLAKHRPHVLTEFHPKCIRENTDFEPAEYLRTLIEYSGSVEVLHRQRQNVVCKDAESIYREWQLADEEFRMNGAMHIDLYAPAPGR